MSHPGTASSIIAIDTRTVGVCGRLAIGCTKRKVVSISVWRTLRINRGRWGDHLHRWTQPPLDCTRLFGVPYGKNPSTPQGWPGGPLPFAYPVIG